MSTRQVVSSFAAVVRRSLLLASILSTLVFGMITQPHAAGAQDEPPVRYRDPVFERVERTPDIVYGSAIDIPTGQPVDLMLDLYQPAGDTEEGRPAFIFVHGGGFRQGTRAAGRRYCDLYARRGYVAVSISYRLNQGNVASVGIPAAVSDTRQAVRWVREHAEQYRLDTDRIVIGGSSAGGITALFLAYTDVERETGGTSSGVAGVMDLWGALYTEIEQMEAGEPPLVIIHGTEDKTVPFRFAVELRDRAEEVGVPYAYYPLEGVGHGSPDVAGNTAKAAEFFYEQLWPEVTEPTPTTRPTETVPPPTATLAPSPTEPPLSPTPEGGTIYLPILEQSTKF